MIRYFKGTHSTTIDIGNQIRTYGFKPSRESFRICSGTYFWNDDPDDNLELLAMLADHWYELRRQQANRHDYPSQDTIYVTISSDNTYVLDLTNSRFRVNLVKLSQHLGMFNLEEKCKIYANYINDVEKEAKKEFKDESFEFRVILAFEPIPKKVKTSKCLPLFINEAKVLVVRDGYEYLIKIEQPHYFTVY